MAIIVTGLLAATSLSAAPAPARQAPAGKGYTAAFVIDPVSKKVLFEDNADTMLPTASMAKMMTCLIAMEEIAQGKMALDKQVTISARASQMGGSQIYAKQGQTLTMQTLLAATMIESANDAATAIAEAIAGTNEAFAERMNQRAKSLGLTHTVFYDPHGLPDSKNPDHVDKMSARDLATLGIELMKHPLMRQYAKTATMPFTNGTFTAGLTNPNHLVVPGKRDYDPAATGIKTGYSRPAGFCVTASATVGNRQVVAVVMGATKSYGPMSSFGIAHRLMAEAVSKP